ncbi:NAD(P)-binding protein [Acaromyces ingoldii]|uniref:NAD(P)-binding protein n=1 Tax=Acaromyces ingoldii TaxID=215250 RepID=A0A316YPS3_9BASI|nr:NAD(P)-binding protein [Acaromyces ingoldii]PWN89745.1 NAD(P)-binding protein [Acaromyces ingoldii]
MSQTLNAAPANGHGMGRALVVGGSCAIGQAIARSLASDGRQVTVTYHSSKAATTAFVKEHKLMEAAQLDISADRAALESFVLRDKAEHGGKVPNVVVFCAAGIEPVALGDMDATVFQKHFDTVVRGPLFMIQAMYPHLEPDSRIILFSSALARTSAIFDDRYALYASAKAACEQLTKYLSKTLAAKQTTINAIAPGPTDTPGLRAQARSNGTSQSVAEAAQAGDAHVARLASLAPAKRIGTPEEIASPVRFLASKEASWITGAILNVSGGMCVYG